MKEIKAGDTLTVVRNREITWWIDLRVVEKMPPPTVGEGDVFYEIKIMKVLKPKVDLIEDYD